MMQDDDDDDVWWWCLMMFLISQRSQKWCIIVYDTWMLCVILSPLITRIILYYLLKNIVFMMFYISKIMIRYYCFWYLIITNWITLFFLGYLLLRGLDYANKTVRAFWNIGRDFILRMGIMGVFSFFSLFHFCFIGLDFIINPPPIMQVFSVGKVCFFFLKSRNFPHLIKLRQI